jgi:putative ABC transport system permease protein
LGIAVTTAVATMALDVGDRVGRELRAFGANIALTPAVDGLPVSVGGVDYRPVGSGAFLAESELVKLRKIFWRNNIMAFAPYLYLPGTVEGRQVVLVGSWFDKQLSVDKSESFRTGLKSLQQTWKVEGHWPADEDSSGCLVGRRLAAALGLAPGAEVAFLAANVPTPNAAADVTRPTAMGTLRLQVRGVLESGGEQDDQIIAPLAVVQGLAGAEGKFRRADVSALTKPEDAFARSDVTKLSTEEFDRWYCTPYVSAICYQIQQAIPGAEAKPVYRVAETEGRILGRVGLLMALLAAAALITSALAVASMMLATVLERRAEIGLYKSLGATNSRVAAILLLEAMLVGLLGGLAGYFAGSLMARHLGALVFGLPAGFHWVVLPPALALALLVTLAGAAWPLARGLKLVPVAVLRND